VSVPTDLKRYYGDGDLHFITFSCYRRQQFLGTARRRDLVLRQLESTRIRYQLTVAAYVVMPEHLHLLVTEPLRGDLSAAIKALKQSISRKARGSGRQKADTRQSDLFVQSPPPRSFWQRRFYDFNVYTEKKRVEKLRYIHRNPVTRGLVKRPEDWRWSSFRYYAFGEQGPVAINVGFTPAWSSSPGKKIK
jgi:putative transposase